MKFAITGADGFVGRNISRRLVHDGHEGLVISSGHNQTDPSIRNLLGIRYVRANLEIPDLEEAFAGCHGIAHCAGINRELGEETYQRVHLQGTRDVISAAVRAGVRSCHPKLSARSTELRRWFLGWIIERVMITPLVSTAQVRMLSEGLAEPCTPCDPLPSELAPSIRFGCDQIRKGLPKPGPFRLRDIRGCGNRKPIRDTRRFFYEMP